MVRDKDLQWACLSEEAHLHRQQHVCWGVLVTHLRFTGNPGWAR